MKKSVLFLNGPNLGKLGTREPEIYGTLSLDELNKKLAEKAHDHGWNTSCCQSNHEGFLIDAIEKAQSSHNAIIFNPGGLTHTSISLHDAVKCSNLPVIEVHLSNIYSRAEFRRTSLIAPVCEGTISGFGQHSYLMALDFIISRY